MNKTARARLMALAQANLDHYSALEYDLEDADPATLAEVEHEIAFWARELRRLEAE